MTVGKAMFRNAVDKFGHPLLFAQVEEEEEAASGARADRSDLSVKLDRTSNRLEEYALKVDDLKRKYAILDTELEDIGPTLDSKINMLNDELNKLVAFKSTAITDLTTTNTRLGRHSARMGVIESQLTALKAQVDDAKLGDISQKLQTLESNQLKTLVMIAPLLPDKVDPLPA